MKHINALLAIALATLTTVSCRKEDREVVPHTLQQSPNFEALAKNSSNGNNGNKKQLFIGSLLLNANPQVVMPCTGSGTDLGTYTGSGAFSSGLVTPTATAQIRSFGTPLNGVMGFDVTTVCAEISDGNGDKIFTYTYPYQILFGAASTTLQIDITGGTGAYANAKGSFIGTMTMSSTGTMFSINGDIKY